MWTEDGYEVTVKKTGGAFSIRISDDDSLDMSRHDLEQLRDLIARSLDGEVN